MNLLASGYAGPAAASPRAIGDPYPVNSPFDQSDLRKVTVIGAGAMGSGIAALIASAGIRVRLLDMVRDGDDDRNAVARAGVFRQLNAEGFTHPAQQSLVEIGNLEDDLHSIGDSDWIVEAIVEDLQTKRGLFARIEEFRSKNSLVSSNTSTIPLKDLIEGRSETFRRNFFITHFFNPPRRMQLLEVVGVEATDPQSRTRIVRWATELLGKSVVLCRDTPGFIANRIGNYWMSVAALEAMATGLTVEEADAVMSRPFGVPRTGVFGLFDFVGINLVPLVWGSLLRMLPAGDAFHNHDITLSPRFASMLEQGLTGRFGPVGFYRRAKSSNKTSDEVLDLTTGEYRDRQAPAAINHEGLRALCESPTQAGRYAWSVLSHLVQYSSAIAGEIAEDIQSIDLAMRIGYNWERGPFELADEVGADWIVARLELEGREVPPLLREAGGAGGFRTGVTSHTETDRSSGPLMLASKKQNAKSIYKNVSASLWDIGDGVACLEIHTKLNACDEYVIEAIQQATQLIPQVSRALVIGSDDGRAFSAGAKLDVFIAHAQAKGWGKLREFVTAGQQALLGLKYAPFPVVAAAAGLALGGGCELMMHCDVVLAHSELQAGFPERNVGIVPGWGGCAQMLLRRLERNLDVEEAAFSAFSLIESCHISRSALFAREAGILRPSDRIIMSRAHLLERARALAVELVEDYRAPEPARIVVSGTEGRTRLQATIDLKLANKTFTQTDAGIAEELAVVLTGGNAKGGAVLSEREVMALEVDAMVGLAKRSTTLARQEHLRLTNKPLRN
jgi:3-hydroxyacyl-CoA dehydrogenase